LTLFFRSCGRHADCLNARIVLVYDDHLFLRGKLMNKSVAYQYGYQAYLGPAKGKTNPYPPGTAEEREWQDGFDTAQADCAW
jgi:hypothetical protein